jgi:hypothetical protein
VVLDRGNEVLTYKRYSVYSIVHAFSFSHTVSLNAALQYLRLPDRTDTAGGGGGIHTLTPRLGDMQDATITISMYI